MDQPSPTIRRCLADDLPTVLAIINEAAEAYRGVIPADRWHDPYMPAEQLQAELDAGVEFWGAAEGAELVGVMGLQLVRGVALIRHAYVRPSRQSRGLGRRLLEFLADRTDRPILVGTWADAGWAIGFYQRHGFQLVTPDEKDRLLRRYWQIPERQVATSVVLADARWRRNHRGVPPCQPPDELQSVPETTDR